MYSFHKIKSTLIKKQYDAVLLYLKGRFRCKFLRLFAFCVGQCLDTYLFTPKAMRKPSSSAKKSGHAIFFMNEQGRKFFHIISTCMPEEAGMKIFENRTVPRACRLVEKWFQINFRNAEWGSFLQNWTELYQARLYTWQDWLWKTGYILPEVWRFEKNSQGELM